MTVREAPYPVGTRVRFAGPNAFAYSEKWVRPGEVGEVVEVHAAQEPSGLMLDIGGEEVLDPGLAGWSTAIFPSGCKVAIDADDETRFVRVP